MLAGARRLTGAPLIRLRCAQAPSPTGGEGGHRVTATPITTVRDWLKRCYRASPSPRVGEGGRAGAKRRRGRMRGAGRSAAPSWSTPHPPSLRSGTFSHRGRRGAPRHCHANHHRSRLAEALLSRLSFSPCGRRWPSRSEAQARSDEGCWTERGAAKLEHPYPSRLPATG